jgi:hypothetical protein
MGGVIIILIIIALYFYLNFLFAMCCLKETDFKQFLVICLLGIPIAIANTREKPNRFSRWWNKL